MSRGLAALVLVVPVAVAFAPAPKPKADSEYYFPLRKGTKWVYELNGQERVFIVTAVTDKGAEKHVATSALQSGKEEPYQTWAVSKKGLAVLEVGGTSKFDEPFVELRLPAKAGDRWAIHSRGQGIVDAKGTRTTTAIEEIEVPAGKFKACRVEMEVTDLDGQVLATPWRGRRWYAPGVGLVKIEYEGLNGAPGFKEVLKSFTPGKR